MHLKQYLLVALTAGFVITSVSSVVAQPMTADQGQSHQGHQANQGQGDYRKIPIRSFLHILLQPPLDSPAN